MPIFAKGTKEMTAENVTYDNTVSEFTAEDVQNAIDEIDASVDILNDLKAISKEYTLAPANWVDGVYTINDSLITIGTNASTQIISYPSESYTDELYDILAGAMIRVVSVVNGQIRLKAMGTVPTVNLPIIITYQTGADPIVLSLDNVPTDGSQNAITSDGVYQALHDTYYWSNEDLGYDSTTYTGVSLNVNKSAGIATLRLYGNAAKALTSGTTYTIATIPSEIKAIVGQHYVRGNGAVASANTIVIIDFNTWEEANYISIIPRAAVSSGAAIVGCITWPI